MAKSRIFDVHGRPLDDDETVVPPGGFVRVELPWMDGMARRAAQAFAALDGDGGLPRIHDGMGNPAGFRPGYAFVDRTPADQGMYEDMRVKFAARLSEAWRRPQPAPVDDQSDDAVPTFKRGKRQMRFARNELRGRQGSMTPDQAYEAHKLALASAWRSP
jgi:hypothetical protein